MMFNILMSGNICGVHSDKHIFILFLVVSPPLFVTNLSVSLLAPKKPTDICLVRGFIEAEHKSIQSPPYNFPRVSIILAFQVLNT